MPSPDELLARARGLDPAALEALLADGYAMAGRVACALTGNERVGRAVGGYLMWRCLDLLPRWRSGTSAENWFLHHAVLTARQVEVPAPEPLEDPLVGRVGETQSPPPAYLAFVRALRHLPAQQREAFILHHGEKLSPRLVGVAMDCSADAAATHLQAATDAVAAVSEGPVESHVATMAAAYAALRSAQPDPLPTLRGHVKRHRRRVLVRRLVRVMVVAIVIAMLGLLVWLFRGPLLRLLEN